ncbi:MAG TPA: DNA topoisomerase IB [Methylophilaceae bacterium]|nr:DNA topoisomerase IB [Methylophilaceae bacterium]
MHTSVQPSESDSTESARAAGLRYVSDQSAGIKRLKQQQGFRYVDKNGQPITDESVIARIKSLAIPPAWQDVWICHYANGHLQATGRDARGRKQYRYHPKWREVRDEVKYERMINFGKALPKLREKVIKDLSLPGLPKEKVLAAVVRMLDLTGVRIGNEEYAKENNSFGLTTLLNKHVRVEGTEIELRFRGKSKVYHALKVKDRRMANIIKRLRDLPGQELFQYLDEQGNMHSIGSDDVNEYLRSVTGEDYTAKDFRTWTGTVLATLLLLELTHYGSKSEAKKNVDQTVKMVAERLGNTPRICKTCYIHPAVFDTYLDEEKWKQWHACVPQEEPSRCAEEIVLDFLQQHAAIVV